MTRGAAATRCERDATADVTKRWAFKEYGTAYLRLIRACLLPSAFNVCHRLTTRIDTPARKVTRIHSYHVEDEEREGRTSVRKSHQRQQSRISERSSVAKPVPNHAQTKDEGIDRQEEERLEEGAVKPESRARAAEGGRRSKTATSDCSVVADRPMLPRAAAINCSPPGNCPRTYLASGSDPRRKLFQYSGDDLPSWVSDHCNITDPQYQVSRFRNRFSVVANGDRVDRNPGR
ncbi:hypothetical protein G5I_12904 [Acromyrmex echinatior]|uniref:Uncharacterized protein n=1 Tax=Acromyrmex echinatior TaxID=103372 RepID=F4X401_ACREC|nr:hypothetical protein G5I_12904 [Acromyrmex echinatior]